MEIIRRIPRMREEARRARIDGRTVSLVPTMGALHDGHLSLVREARRMSDLCVVSIFVNPIQFGPDEDFDRYPRDLERDAEVLAREKADILFSPEVNELYPEGFTTTVKVEGLSDKLCGADRPGHFQGVTTIVCKLLHIVSPHFAFFGQKDAQQFIIVKRMIQDLDMDVELILMPTIREKDGLAMSSRNAYLTPEERDSAPKLYQALGIAQKRIEEAQKDPEPILKAMREFLQADPRITIDYLEMTDMERLEPVTTITQKVLVAGAVRIGRTRLIDNIIVKPPAQ